MLHATVLTIERDKFISSLVESDRKFNKDRLDNTIYLVRELHWADSVCRSVPKDEQPRIVQLQSWEQTTRTLQERKQAIEGRISKLSADAESNPALGSWYDSL